MARPTAYGRVGRIIPSPLLGVTVRNDRRVNCQSVPCGTCGAKVGEHCLTSLGFRLAGTHGTRRRVALREERA